MRLPASLLAFLLFTTSAAYGQKHPAVIAGEQFFELLIRGQSDVVYKEAGSLFKQHNDEATFETLLEESGAAHIKSFEVKKAEAFFEGSEVQITGRSKDEAGKSLVAKVRVVREGDTYRLQRFFVGPVRSSSPLTGTTDPDKNLAAVKATMSRIVGAIAAEDLAAYHNQISIEDRQRFGLAQTSRLITNLEKSGYGPVSALMEKVTLRKDSELANRRVSIFAKVDFPERKRRIILDFSSQIYDQQSEPWLTQWRVQYLNADSSIVEPTEAEAKSLAVESVKLLLESADKGSFETYFNHCSPFMQELIPLSRMEQIFARLAQAPDSLDDWELDKLTVVGKELDTGVGASVKVDARIPNVNGDVLLSIEYIHETDRWAPINLVYEILPTTPSSAVAP